MSARGERWRALAPLVLGSLVGLAWPGWAGASEPASFDYLYIEANEGGSSGGHAAIRFGRYVYHFQNREDLLVLDRERADEFLFSYALLNNRTIHVSRIGVKPEVETRLAARFLRRFRAQEAQLAVRGALRHDLALLESAEAASVPVRGYGYFQPETPAPGPASAALRALRERIAAQHGEDFLGRRRRAVLEALHALAEEDAAGWPIAPPVSSYDHPPFAQPWSSQLVDLAAGLAALDVLEGARVLDPAAVHAPSGDDFRLARAERAALMRFASELEGQLADLVDSSRDDWGQTLLVGMARLATFDASVASDRFMFLDSYPVGHGTIDADTVRRRSDIVPSMLGETREQLRSARSYFAHAKDPGELAWQRVEERLGRHHELARAARGESDLRVAPGHLVPERSAPYPLPALEPRPGAELARVRARERDYTARVDRLHRYGLISQNCASAIFETLNDEFAGSVEASRSELGGYVSGDRSLAFIPFVSSDQVRARYHVIGRHTLRSYRQARLREMREQESPLWVALRESNTFTARTYHRGERDSFFIFFTEDPVWLRPLLGAVNLVGALGESAWGLVKLPFDRGQTLISGLKGTFVSLPELAFANIRKGSNDWIAPEHRHLDPQALRPQPVGTAPPEDD